VEVRLPEVFLEDACLADAGFVDVDCFPLAAFGADLDDFAVDFLAVVFLADDLALGAGVAAHTASAVLNARTMTIAFERKI
jgi:hypothetical protein